jgi:hypothetical protein
MSAWGIGLYASDFALDLRATVGAVARLPLDEDKLVAAICAAEETTAENPADEDFARAGGSVREAPLPTLQRCCAHR